MSILDEVSVPGNRPIVATITGDSGVGKTTLASTFPKPVFVRAEDGLQAIPYAERPAALPKIDSVDQLWKQLKGLINDEHEFQTVVIDSVTALERLFVEHIVSNDPHNPPSINQAMGGYGAGVKAVGAMHQRVRKAAEALVERRGIHVVFIAHSETNKVEPPDHEAYTRNELRLNKNSMAAYVDDVDLVGYLKLEMFTRGKGDTKKAVSDGTRILVTYASAAQISKNRYGIEQDLTVERGVNPLADLIPSLTTSNDEE